MRLLLAVLWIVFWTLPAAAQGQQRLALVIGNQNYAQVRRLDNALADARAVAATLRERGFQVTDRYDLDRVGMLREFDTFRRRIVSGSVVVFYFAGHGVALDGTNYLLPVDIARESEEMARYNALPLESVMDALATQNNRSEHGLNLLIIDACRDNPFRNFTRSGGARAGLSTKPGAGLMMLYAAASGQAALDKLDEADRDPNGVFTRTLLKAMRTPGLGVRAMAEQVQREVGALSGRRQVPAFYSEALGDYVFTPGVAAAEDAQARRVAELERQVEELRRTQARPEPADRSAAAVPMPVIPPPPAVPAPVPSRGGPATQVADQEALNRLRNNRGLALQWISWDYFGTITLDESQPLMRLRGTQVDRERPRSRMVVDGEVLSIDASSFVFRGRIEIYEAPSDRARCIRDGTFTFRITSGRRYWRLRENSACGDLADYVDIFF